MHCRNSQSKVRIRLSDLNVPDVLVAEFRESILHGIPEIIGFLSDSELSVRRASADALAKLSEQGRYQMFWPGRF